ncbi:MAG: phosphoenolpyruvate carboxylase, partial [Candidatus Woesearchaeota archaeon]|nr:phosphoenolpyruvate carboxylase [Candidatus Woesearchaeota archaeon]
CFDDDLKDSLRFLNKDNLNIFPSEVSSKVEDIAKITNYDVDEKHKKVTSIILENFKAKDYKLLTENITRAGFIRGFLG